jgi:hypothetical protein
MIKIINIIYNKIKKYNYKIIILKKIFINEKIRILKHNGIKILDYPEESWSLVPFPAQKGDVFNADNLATVNRHKFTSDEKFKEAKFAGESRWSGVPIRDISWRLNVILWATGKALKNTNNGEIFIECGTGKGYMAAAIAKYHNFKLKSPDFYLIDTYLKNFNISEHNSLSPADFAYTDNVDEVKDYFKTYSSIKVVKGLIPEILNQLPKRNIALLHVDLNNAKAEKAALHFLKEYFISGTILVFDDYGGPGGEDQAIEHERFAKENEKDLLILPTGQSIIIW